MTAPTQVDRPWRSTTRTVFQLAIGLASLLPLVVAGVYDDPSAAPAAVTQALAVAGLITRVMALPAVETFLATWLPWLAADPDSAWKTDEQAEAVSTAATAVPEVNNTQVPLAHVRNFSDDGPCGYCGPDAQSCPMRYCP